jgi:3,4-dihydroxy 2-butanone 4-phosphate synthase
VSLLLQPRVARALDLLRAGEPVLVYDADGREEETDLFLAAHRITPAGVRLLRREAGGLVFLAVDGPVAARLGLPFLQDVLAAAAPRFPALAALEAGRLPYDARSSFSLTLNHRKTFTGITDADRALTIRRFAELASELQAEGVNGAEAPRRLGEEFRSPGHVALCVASEPLLVARRGHTELGAALARMAGIPGVLAGAEMLGEDHALPRTQAEAWARERGSMLVAGDEVAAAWATFIPEAGHGRARA